MGNQGSKRRETGSALQKAMAVLEAVVNSQRNLSLSDLADRTGMSRQSAHRVVRQLEENGLLVHEPLGERYLVGQRLKQLSLTALAAAQRTGASHQILENLVDQIGETCNIGVLDGREVIYLDRVECDWPLRLQLQSGSRLPAHASAIGKLLLAHLPAKTRNRLIAGAPLTAYTPHTITDPVRLEEALRAIREQEFAVNDQEYTLGLLGIAVPIHDNRRRVVAALAFHAPEARVSEAQARVHIPALRAAAERLGRFLEANGADGEEGEP